MSERASGCASFLKAMFVLFGILTILALLGIGFGWRWWSTHKKELMDSAKNISKEGNRAGESTDDQGCLDLAVGRLKKNGGITGNVSTGLFLRFCLETSKMTPGFCDGAPQENEIMDSATWRVAKCRNIDLDKNDCQNLFGAVQRYCHSEDHLKKERQQGQQTQAEEQTSP